MYIHSQPIEVAATENNKTPLSLTVQLLALFHHIAGNSTQSNLSALSYQQLCASDIVGRDRCDYRFRLQIFRHRDTDLAGRWNKLIKVCRVTPFCLSIFARFVITVIYILGCLCLFRSLNRIKYEIATILRSVQFFNKNEFTILKKFNENKCIYLFNKYFIE